MYNYRQHNISEETAMLLEEAEAGFDNYMRMAKAAWNDRDYADWEILSDKAYECLKVFQA